MADPFFEVIHDGEWNACVGIQGSETNYVDGYLEAARILADAVIEKEMFGSRDTLALPILFNVRHGLELALKYTVDLLSSIKLVPNRERGADHDILGYWRHLDTAVVPDRKIRQLVAELEQFVRSLSRVDREGQELRYFKRQDGVRSLNDLAVVNLPHVRRSVEGLGALLRSLTERAQALQDDHGTGTSTTRCSRSDLVEITGMVGDHATWTDESFFDRRRAVMDRFGLTKRAVSNAIAKIRETRPLASRVGIETDLTHLQEEHAVQLACEWLKVFPPRPDDFAPDMVGAAALDLDGMEPYLKAVRALVETTERELSLEEFADVETIFYIGRDNVPGEYYEKMLGETLARHQRRPRSQIIRNVVSKKTMLPSLIVGLRQVGRPSLAARLEDVRQGAEPGSTGCEG